MENFAQDILDSVESIKYPKMLKKNKVLEEKNHIKSLIFKERSTNPALTPFEISNKFGISKDEAKEILKEFLKESIEKSKEVTKKPEKIKKIKENIKNKLKPLKKSIDKDDKETIKNILGKIILFGIPLNFSLAIIFGINFGWFTWIAWGYAFWFIKKEIVNLVRGLWIK